MEKEGKKVKDKVAEVVKNFKSVEKENRKGDKKEIKPLVTCHVLFVSVLDKIYIVLMLLMLIGMTYYIFGSGDISSLHYGFWSRVGREIVSLIVLFVIYLFLNWFYKCAIKTMLCVTENEIYVEKYVPFKRSELTIPLEKVTGVSTLNLFWILRCVSIHRYHQFPVIFWTWNNEEFKDKVAELTTGDKEDVENEYESKSIITKDRYKYVAYVGIALIAIVALIGIVRLWNYMFSPEKKVAGTYKYESNKIVLEKNGNCSIDDIIDDVTECTWTYDREDEEVRISYTYEYKSFYTSTRNSHMTLFYDSNKKSLDYHGKIFAK